MGVEMAADLYLSGRYMIHILARTLAEIVRDPMRATDRDNNRV